MAEPLERLTNLLALLLETVEPLTLEQIGNELAHQYPSGESARRGAFERDKSVLRDLGVPIEQQVLAGDQAGRTAYRIDRRRYELADLDLTDDERHALQLAVAAARSDDTWGQDGLWKLGAGSERPSLAVAATVPSFEALPPLREAIASRTEVEFEYHHVGRTLDPYGLLLRDGYWYVIGRDHGRDEVRTYRVDRIAGAVRLGGRDQSGSARCFDRPAGFDIRSVFPSDPKLMGHPEDEMVRAIVRIDARRAALVAVEVGDEAVLQRNGDGSIDVEVPCVNREAFRSWLLGLTDNAVVIAPDDLRAETIEWLTAIVVSAAGGAS
jgi:predicted DNA-binding transcriptional regulator YafY